MAKWFRVQDFQLHPLGSNLALVTGASVTLVNRQMICLLPVEVFIQLSLCRTCSRACIQLSNTSLDSQSSRHSSDHKASNGIGRSLPRFI